MKHKKVFKCNTLNVTINWASPQFIIMFKASTENQICSTNTMQDVGVNVCNQLFCTWILVWSKPSKNQEMKRSLIARFVLHVTRTANLKIFLQRLCTAIWTWKFRTLLTTHSLTWGLHQTSFSNKSMQTSFVYNAWQIQSYHYTVLIVLNACAVRTGAIRIS